MSGHRKIGPVLATMLVASCMVGSGIYLLPATLATVGSITVVGWLIATAGALLIAAVLAKLAQVVPAPAGLCVYPGEAMGPYMGFQASVIYWLGCWSGNLAIAIGATGYLAHFFPVLAGPLPAACATIGLIWALTLLNIAGPRLVCQCDSLTMVVGVIPILLVALIGWWFFDPQLFRASWNVQHLPDYRAVPDSLVLVFWAFLGLESASIATGVVENPRRNVPLASLCGVLIAGLIYIGSCTVIMGLIPAQRLAVSTAPFADAVRLMLGPFAAACVALMALIKIVGTLLGWILLTAQMGKAGADRGQFPRVFGWVDRRGVPVAGLLIVAAVTSAIALATMSPTLAEQFGKVIEVTVILSLLNYLYACVAVWHYARLPTIAPAERAQLRRYQPLALAAMLFCLLMIVRSDVSLLALSAVIVFLTYPLYPFASQETPGAPRSSET
jgi:arginine:agmatine antiporter